ncbi:hypothetical protein ACFL41_00350 [Gemmatimonadota bacterium]
MLRSMGTWDRFRLFLGGGWTYMTADTHLTIVNPQMVTTIRI